MHVNVSKLVFYYLTCGGMVVVSCPASLLHTGKESGESEFWFRALSSWRDQSDCRTVLMYVTGFVKDCDANLKGLIRRGFSHQSMKLPIG